MNEMKNRYLDGAKIFRLRGRAKAQRIAGWCILIFMALGIIGFLSDGEFETVRDSLAFYLLFIALGGWLLYLGIRNRRNAEAAERFAAIFLGDKDGVVTLEELCRAVNLPSGKVLAMLNQLTRASLFQNCVLQSGGNCPCVVLSDAQLDTRHAGFVNVQCPNCSGTTRIRFGTVGTCEYCGSPIRGDRG